MLLCTTYNEMRKKKNIDFSSFRKSLDQLSLVLLINTPHFCHLSLTVSLCLYPVCQFYSSFTIKSCIELLILVFITRTLHFKPIQMFVKWRSQFNSVVMYLINILFRNILNKFAFYIMYMSVYLICLFVCLYFCF